MFLGAFDKSQLPRKSGVYLFKDRLGQVLYVGKAIDLYHRVASYFSPSQTDPKTVALLERIASVETIIVESELEALILEANLIKKYLPPFNIRLTDDKDYLYIKFTKEDFPKVVTARKKELKGTLKYFGPFPSGRTVRNTLKQLRRVFPWCSGGRRVCFYYHLGLCPGPCAGVINQCDYRQIINRFCLLLQGKKEQLVNGLFKEMTRAAQKQNFEEAGRLKKIIDGINYLTQANRAQAYLENRNFLEDETNQALQALQNDLGLSKLPLRIEAYDISNISGKDATGSMVVLTNGEIDKSQYRKFKIHPPAGGPAGGAAKANDVGMMREMIGRRLTHKEWSTPDLILVDGGRGQARAAQFSVFSFQFSVPVFGLAKRREWLYPPEGAVIKLPKASLSLRLLQKIRDEAHRFALSYHRKLRDTIMIR